jgi:hypothetical protein
VDGCGNLSLTLRDEHTVPLGVREQGAVENIRSYKEEEVTGGWRKLDNKLHYLYFTLVM